MNQMKKLVATIMMIALTIGLFPIIEAKASDTTCMYRMYNKGSGEHFYTASAGEKIKLINNGWIYEGISWIAPNSGDPVYRVYNPYTGDHHYTLNSTEKDNLVRNGWKDEGIGWYSYSGGTPLYRLYNPNAVSGSHHYTTSRAEADSLITSGWKDEGIGWNATPDSYSIPQKGWIDLGNNISAQSFNIFYYDLNFDDYENAYGVVKVHNDNNFPITGTINYQAVDISGNVIKSDSMYINCTPKHYLVSKIVLPLNTMRVDILGGNIQQTSANVENLSGNISGSVSFNDEYNTRYANVTVKNDGNKTMKSVDTMLILYDENGNTIDCITCFSTNLGGGASETSKRLVSPLGKQYYADYEMITVAYTY